ncbi:MAG: penicillin-binding protein 2 [Nitrospirota bacterium]|nr:penicillin-binding protein 2 [Nitrospirota bacterium]
MTAPRKGSLFRRAPRPRVSNPGPLGGRTALLGVCVAAAFAVVLVQLTRLQVVQAGGLSARAERQHHKTIRLSGERGTITDRNGRILAKNMDVPSITADPASVENPRATARKLARLLPVSDRSLEKRLKGNRHFAWIQRHADPAAAERVMALNLPGIHQVPESRRFYPKGKLLGHILGFAGSDNQGLSGIERAYDSQLKGGEVRLVMQRDALGRTVVPTGTNYRRPDHGADLTLTIDEVIQHHVERELDRLMEESQPTSASVIVMDPDTGEILAMAVRPEFDPNRAGRYQADDFRNRILTDPYEPGSTMKVFMAATALDAGVVTLDELIDCEGGYLPLRGGAMRDTHPYDEITFAEVLAKSSNIGSTKVAMRLGPDALYAGYRRFGFGQRTGIELGGESGGVLPSPDRWSVRSLPSIAIGQELSATPLQIITAASAVANGGRLMRPYLVKAVEKDGETITVQPIMVRRVMSEEAAAKLRDALVAVTEADGTAPKAALPGYRVAGKTGTAQKARSEGRGYAKGKYVASFLGMVPADNPRLVMLVVVDEPEGRYYGGTVAAPVFRAVAGPALHYLGIHPRTDRTVVVAGEPGMAVPAATAERANG